MKYLNSFICLGLGLGLGMTLLTSCREQTKATNDSDIADATTAEAVRPEVVFENEFVRVVRVVLQPGQELASHEGGRRLIYSVTDYNLQWEQAGEEAVAKSLESGDLHYHSGGQHAAMNSGESVAEWVAFIHKGNPLPNCPEEWVKNDAASKAPDYAIVQFENDVFRVVKVSLPTGAAVPMHSGINRLIYSLNDYSLIYEDTDEEKAEWSMQKNTVHWHEACEHAVENQGEVTAEYLVVGFKETVQVN